MFKKCALTSALLALAACGGGSSYDGPTVTPVAARGFATADTGVGRGETLTAVDSIRLLGDSDANISRARQDVSVSIAEDGQTLDIVLDGVTHTLTGLENGTYSLQDGTTIVRLTRIHAPSPEAEIVDIFSSIDGQLNDANLVIGFDTNPRTIAAAAGTAEMTGRVALSARNRFSLNQMSGPAALSVDFDRNTVSGTFEVTTDGSDLTDFSLGTTALFALEEAPIVGNGFDGTFRLQDGAVNGQILDPTYTGRFYGDQGQTAGGQIAATLEHGEGQNGEDLAQTFIEGAFLVSE